MSEPLSKWRAKKPEPKAPEQKKTEQREPDLVQDAKVALGSFWGSAGDLGAAEAAEACRKLTKQQLVLLEAWVPSGQGRTADKCRRAREIVKGVIAEKA